MYCFDAEIVGPWVSKETGGTWTPYRGQAIGKISANGELQAGVIYEDFNGANVVCHIAIKNGIVDRQFLALIFDYPFIQLNARRITAPISETNKKSINLVTKMGFVLESRLDQATLDSDLLIYRMFKHECRYLQHRYARSLQG